MNIRNAKPLPGVARTTPTTLDGTAVEAMSGALTTLLADLFGLYVKTENFRWQLSGTYLRNYRRLIAEETGQISTDIDVLGELLRRIGATTLHSIARSSRLQRALDRDADFVTRSNVLAGPLAHDHRPPGSRHEIRIEPAERRSWFLSDPPRPDLAGG